MHYITTEIMTTEELDTQCRSSYAALRQARGGGYSSPRMETELISTGVSFAASLNAQNEAYVFDEQTFKW